MNYRMVDFQRQGEQVLVYGRADDGNTVSFHIPASQAESAIAEHQKGNRVEFDLPDGAPGKRSDQMTPEERKEAVLAVPSDEMSFEITRDNREPNRTFSKEALTELLDSITLFIGTRISLHMEDGFKVNGHQRARVDVKVTIDGESWTVPEDIKPWFKVDGTVRDAALKEAKAKE